MATMAVLASCPLFRAGLASLLQTMGFNPVKQAADVKELQQQLDEGISPEMLLIDLSHGGDKAVSADDIRTWAPVTKVVLLASELDLGLLSDYFAAGACGYLLEKISANAFEESIRLVHAGEKVFPSELASMIPGLAPVFRRPPSTSIEFEKSKLSLREIDILRCLTNGQSNKAIANTLDIAESTVKVHVKRILQKIHASNRTQAALWGAARGLAAERSHELSQFAEMD